MIRYEVVKRHHRMLSYVVSDYTYKQLCRDVSRNVKNLKLISRDVGLGCDSVARFKHVCCINSRYFQVLGSSDNVNLTRQNVGAVWNSGIQARQALFGKQQLCLGMVRNMSTRNSIAEGWFYQALYDSPPALYAQEMLLQIHNISGLSWGFTIVLSTVVLRALITFPLALYQSYILAKVENLKIEMNELVKTLKEETNIAVRAFNWTEHQARVAYNYSLKKQWNKLLIRDNCHPAKAGILMLVQIPLWVSLSLALRNFVFLLPTPDAAAQITLLEFGCGGTLWFHNLLLPDSTWILPILFGLTNLTIVEVNALTRTHAPSKIQKWLTHILRGASIIMIPVAASVPSSLSLYWTTSSLVGLIQNLVILSPRVRRICGIPDTANTLERPYSHIYSRLRTRVSQWPTSPHPPSTS